MLEGGIQTKIQNFLKTEGFTCLNLIKVNKSGFPDLLILIGKGKHFWVEVKRPEGVESKIQQFRIKKLRENGDIVIVPYGYKDFLDQYEDVFKKKLRENINNLLTLHQELFNKD